MKVSDRVFPAVDIIILQIQMIKENKMVVVGTRVGKKFPGTRQNEREMKFIRVGDAVRTAGQLKGEPTLNGGSLVHFYTQRTRVG